MFLNQFTISVFRNLMKFGIRNTSFVYPGGIENIWEDTAARMQYAEKDGFDSFWLKEHFYQITAQGSPFAGKREFCHPVAINQLTITDNIQRRGVFTQRFQHIRRG